MLMKHLPTLSNYIDWIESNDSQIGYTEISGCKEIIDYQAMFDAIIKYNDFLKSTPILADFVPVGKDGKPIEKPSDNMNIRAINDREKYQQALSRVKWEWWKYLNTGILKNINGEVIDWFDEEGEINKHKTYSDFIDADIELEPADELRKELNLT